MNEVAILDNQEKEIVSEIPNEKWTFIKTDECDIHICKCGNKTTYHPNFMQDDIPGCLRCEGIETVAKKLLGFRNFTFVAIVREGKEKKRDLKIKYFCDRNHDCKHFLSDLRKGKGCNKCGIEYKKESKHRGDNVEKIDCNCKEIGLGKK